MEEGTPQEGPDEIAEKEVDASCDEEEEGIFCVKTDVYLNEVKDSVRTAPVLEERMDDEWDDLKFFKETSVLIDWERRRSIHLDAGIGKMVSSEIGCMDNVLTVLKKELPLYSGTDHKIRGVKKLKKSGRFKHSYVVKAKEVMLDIIDEERKLKELGRRVDKVNVSWDVARPEVVEGNCSEGTAPEGKDSYGREAGDAMDVMEVPEGNEGEERGRTREMVGRTILDQIRAQSGNRRSQMFTRC